MSKVRCDYHCGQQHKQYREIRRQINNQPTTTSVANIELGSFQLLANMPLFYTTSIPTMRPCIGLVARVLRTSARRQRPSQTHSEFLRVSIQIR